jgi:hypothetical protein
MRPLVLLIAAVVMVAGCQASNDGSSTTVSSGTEPRPWIDTHAHPVGFDTTCTTATCINAAISTMDTYGVKKSILFSAPAVRGDVASEDTYAAVVALRPDRLFLGAGGSALNPLIQQTPDDGQVSTALRQQLSSTVPALMALRSVVVLGEIASLHLSYNPAHPYEETQANTPLFLLLADQAATYAVPIDLHMDAVSTAMSTPQFFRNASTNNPAQLPANVAAMEALLAYRRDARVIWAHVGRDTTGQMTPQLVGRLVDAHSNLYLQLAMAGPLHTATDIVDSAGSIRSDWLSLLQEHADRFVIGSDTFYAGTSTDGKELAKVKDFLARLPSSLAYQIGCENPVKIYRLSSGC